MNGIKDRLIAKTSIQEIRCDLGFIVINHILNIGEVLNSLPKFMEGTDVSTRLKLKIITLNMLVKILVFPVMVIPRNPLHHHVQTADKWVLDPKAVQSRYHLMRVTESNEPVGSANCLHSIPPSRKVKATILAL